jgi:ankyrin repeat protein
MAEALDLGANINSTDLSVRTHLVLAIRVGKWDMFDFLLSRGADPNVAEKSGLTSIHHLVESSCRSSSYEHERLLRLIQAGVNLAATDATGRTALHVGASLNGGFEALGVLLDRGLSIDARDKRGRTPLHHAAQTGAGEAVIWLLERGASETAVDNDGKTPKIHARRAAVSAFEAWQARQVIANVLNKFPTTSPGAAK